MLIASQKMTAIEFLELPGDPDNTRYELAQGVVIVSPSPSFDHSWVTTKLTAILSPHIDLRALGQLYSDVDSYFGPNDVRRPDLLFFTQSRVHLIDRQYGEISPDLCIEVLSPSNSRYDRVDKFNLYQNAGVSDYWIVDPMEKTFEGYHLRDNIFELSGKGNGSDIVQLPPFPDLPIHLSALWRPRLNK